MRPPRNISGSSSAAARAAVAVAVATAAAAGAHSAPAKGFGAQGVEEDPTGDCNMAWSIESPQSCEASTEQGSGDVRIPGLLVRRASASGQLMRPDENPASSDDTKVKRGLLSSSSSPTSLRALFNAGASANSSSSTATPSHPGSQVGATSAPPLNASEENSNSTTTGAHMDLNVGGTAFDYFDHPIAFSSGSSTTSSTPSSTVLANGLAHFNYPIDTISSTQQWPGFSAQHPHQDPDRQFDVASSSAHSVVSDLAISPAALSVNEPDRSLDIRTAEILSPLSIHSPIQADMSEFQSFASQMTTAYDPTLTEDVGSASGIGAQVQNELKAQQQQEHQARLLPGEGQAGKLQFSDGYAWRQDEVANQGTQGHTRHQSASLVYPQQQSLQFGSSSSSSSSSAQHRSYLTRSLQDLTHYSATVNDQQQRLAEQVRRLQEETAGTQPPQPLEPPTAAPPQDQGVAQDMFGASLALVLDDHLRLLDDMDVVPELNEYEELSQPSMGVPSQDEKNCLLMSANTSLHSDLQDMGSPAVGAISQEASISIFDAIARSASNAQDAMFLGGGDETFKDLSGGMMHFQTEPYIDTLSFLDLSGTYVPPTATTPAAFTSTITSSSLPNTSFLDQQNTRLYHGLLPNLQQHSPAQGLGSNSGINNTLDQQVLSREPSQVSQQSQQPQQHIVHHQHHHHHHVHLH
ncbi:hypothetical protein BGZ68_008864 [Mortierella alpina]|nr:hypothetical protein BGZ68_008864 [Mortierella alpina]